MLNARKILGKKTPHKDIPEYDSKNDGKAKIMFLLIALFLLIMFIYSIVNSTKWFVDQVVAFIFLIILYLDRKHLKLNALSITLVGIALFLPNGGTFGWYELSYGSFYFDNLLHFVGFFAVGVILFNYLKENIGSLPKLILIVLLASTGVGALIEISEYAGYTFLGPGEGMLFFGIGDGMVGSGPGIPAAWINNTKDLLFNVLGSAVGIGLALLSNWYRERKSI